MLAVENSSGCVEESSFEVFVENCWTENVAEAVVEWCWFWWWGVAGLGLGEDSEVADCGE